MSKRSTVKIDTVETAHKTNMIEEKHILNKWKFLFSVHDFSVSVLIIYEQPICKELNIF